ncbi:MAG: sulfotransferase [Phycisphaeraceae bacterium]|nr:sulfotransferase [Phycisphaeraceae bacterium]MCW5754886.1 sulfotransferase [Phycisphaeraceae bacterium]
MIETLRQLLRPLRYAQRRRIGERLARRPSPLDADPGPPPGFIVGCGRSGTTILGKILQEHPQVCYLFEPYHLWAAVDPRTDATNLYHRTAAHMLMDAAMADDSARLRFRRCILNQRILAEKPFLIEKTPHNAMRLGYLEALAPGARYAHIVRDGVSVAGSITKVAEDSHYKIAGRPRLNQWWGEDDVKWRNLVRGGVAAGYYPDEVDRLSTHAQRGAYEWLVSLHEVDKWRSILGDRLHEFTYEALLADGRTTLTDLARFFGLESPEHWLNTSVAMLGAGRTKARTIDLPPHMAEAFNAFQERYGFPGRAEAI